MEYLHGVENAYGGSQPGAQVFQKEEEAGQAEPETGVFLFLKERESHQNGNFQHGGQGHGDSHLGAASSLGLGDLEGIVVQENMADKDQKASQQGSHVSRIFFAKAEKADAFGFACGRRRRKSGKEKSDQAQQQEKGDDQPGQKADPAFFQ